MKRIMIGIDFSAANSQNALQSLREWAGFARNSHQFEIAFGISTDMDFGTISGKKKTDALAAFSAFCPKLACWDESITGKASVALAAAAMTTGINGSAVKAHPFYPSFSYGSLLNRLLMLAFFLSSDYLVRIDPGTLPPADCNVTFGFDEIADKLIKTIGSANNTVSLGFEHRLAIRDMFIKNREQHEKLISEYTGIDLACQVTGGAMFLSKVPGIPAIPFDRFGPLPGDMTLVWGSDDALFRLIHPSEGNIRLSSPLVPRFDSEGMRKTTIQYYRGIAGMVYLSALMKSSETDAMKNLSAFIEILKTGHLDADTYRPETEGVSLEDEFILDNVAPSPFLAKIREGFANYQSLLSGDAWTSLATMLRDKLKDDVLLYTEKYPFNLS